MPAVELSSPASTLTFHEVLVRWGPAYLAQWSSAMPARQREVLATILSCRTPRRGGQLWRCPEHPHYRYVYHSCNDRHCPQCGHGEAQEWLDRQFHRLLLPVEYFLITFTAPEALKEIAPKVWRQRWVVNVEAVGNGENALRYLGRYVFHTATGNRRLPLLPDGRLRWTYRDSQTHQLTTLDLEPFELIRRFLQHVLPAGYSRVRYFGWLSPAARQKANRVRVLLGRLPQLSAAEQAAWKMPADSFDPLVPEEVPVEPRPWLCPQCQRPLILHATWQAGQMPPRPPAVPIRGPP